MLRYILQDSFRLGFFLRIFFTLIFFFLTVYATPTIHINSNLDVKDVVVDQLVDRNKILTLNEVVGSDFAGFEQATKYHFPAGYGAVWAHFYLQNDSNTSTVVFLRNVLPTMNKFDLTVIRANGSRQQFLLGNLRSFDAVEMPHRYHLAPLAIAAGETIEVVARFETIAGLQTLLQVYSRKSFTVFSDIESLCLGLIYGILLTFILYNLIFHKSVRDKSFLFYSIAGFFIIIYLLGINGSLYQFGLPIDFMITSMIYHMSLRINLVFILLFSIYFFDLKNQSKLFYFKFLILIVVTTILAISFFGMLVDKQPFIPMKIQFVINFISMLAIIALGIYAIAQKWLGSFYYFFGTCSFAASSVVYTLYMSGSLEYSHTARYSLTVGIVIEMVLLAFALGARVNEIEGQRKSSQTALLEHAKFITISHALAGIIHQMRQPIVYLGTLITKLELRDIKLGSALAEDDRKLTTDIRKAAKVVDETVMQFYNLYTAEKERESFFIGETIDDAIALLSPEIARNNVKIIRYVDANIQIQSYHFQLVHVLLILISNAVKILAARDVEVPQIVIECNTGENTLEIIVHDNGGGISDEIMSKIFGLMPGEYDTKGFGIGLMLAKHIVENKLNGTISVQNIGEGAYFTIRLPISV